jgi:hypothetical protein
MANALGPLRKRNPTVIDFAASSAGALIGSALAWIGLRTIKIN